MALTMTLLGLRLKFKCPPSKRVVLWSRIDQKSCFKAIVTAGFEVVVVPLCRSSQGEGDELSTDLTALETLLTSHAERVLCVVTTASCFAPRAPDDLEAVARLCKAASSSADGAGAGASGGVASGGVAHVVNNAYGLQCAGTMRRLARAMRVGRVDAVVQSTDKNFLVPVGGAVIAGADKETIEAIGQVSGAIGHFHTIPFLPCRVFLNSRRASTTPRQTRCPCAWGVCVGVPRSRECCAAPGPLHHPALHGRRRVRTSKRAF